MEAIRILIGGMLLGGIITAIIAAALWFYSNNKRITDERIKKLEQDNEDKCEKIEELERDLLRLGQGGDDF